MHQLRVATRRARAALHLFAELLPKRRARWMKKRLRRLRQSAGAVRDLDVLRERLRAIIKEDQTSHLGDVVEQIASRRRKARKPLVAEYKRARRKGFKKRARRLAKSVRWRVDEQEPQFALAAREMLPPLIDAFFAAANADLADISTLHKMRIAGKQVRYAMELLAGAFDDSFRGRLYQTVAAVQENLGAINDHATAIAMFRQWSKRVEDDVNRNELARLIALEKNQLEQKHQAFCEWWSCERASGIRRDFDQLLAPTTADACSAVAHSPAPEAT